MRFVIFDDESMEPITVVNLPGVAERDIFERLHGWLQIHVPPPPLSPVPWGREYDVKPYFPKTVMITFERFIRNGQVSVMAFTKQADLAMLLEPDFLPGQQRRVNEMREDYQALERLLLYAFR